MVHERLKLRTELKTFPPDDANVTTRSLYRHPARAAASRFAAWSGADSSTPTTQTRDRFSPDNPHPCPAGLLLDNAGPASRSAKDTTSATDREKRSCRTFEISGPACLSSCHRESTPRDRLV